MDTSQRWGPRMTEQELTNQMVIKMLDGKSAEFFAALNPDTGGCQVIMKSESPMASCILFTQIIERLAKNGLEPHKIRIAVEMGLDSTCWRE